jgi:hypothetical protein
MRARAGERGSGSTTRAFGAALMCGVAAVLAWVPGAQAAITESNVVTPADGSLLVQNRISEPAKTFTVTGTSNGTTGDKVDIDCYQGTGSVGGYTAGIAVAADGSFAAEVPQAALPAITCHLVAVPHATTPSPGAAYTGPRVGFSSFSTSRVGEGPNAGDLYDLSFYEETMSAQSFLYSIDDCGPGATLLDGSSAVNLSGYMFNCGGSFYNAPQEFFATKELDLTRAEIQVDGQNAYGSATAHGLFSVTAGERAEGKKASDELEGFPALSASLDSFNTTTGEAQTTESEQLVRCTPEDLYVATRNSCKAFASTGVSITRITHYTDAGRVATVTDTYRSTDGAPHTLDLWYESDIEGSAPGWQLPGEATFSKRETNETGTAPSGSGTIYTINNTSQAPGFSNVVGALTFAAPYNWVRFDNKLWAEYGAGEKSALFDYERTLSPGGSTSITWSYATGTSLAEVQADADQAQPPSIAISAPGEGVALGAPVVTVNGTASAGSGISSVSVNGVAAAVSGSSFSASVPIVPGADGITAKVTSVAGNTATAQLAVSYVPPTSPSSPTGMPVVRDAHQSASRWREGGALAQISRSRRHRLPMGTTFSFTLNEAASARLAFTQAASGRRVRGQCAAATRRNRRKHRCSRTVTAGALSFAGQAGSNTVRFEGRVSRARKLRPGRYTLVITATDAAGQSSAPAELTFTVAR